MEMDNVLQAYKDAYHRANGANIRVRKNTRIRYIIQGKEYTERQLKGFTETLLARKPYFSP